MRRDTAILRVNTKSANSPGSGLSCFVGSCMSSTVALSGSRIAACGDCGMQPPEQGLLAENKSLWGVGGGQTKIERYDGFAVSGEVMFVRM